MAKEITIEQIKRVKTNYIYSNMREVCDDMQIDYELYRRGGNNDKLMMSLDEYFDIDRVSCHKRMFRIRGYESSELIKNENELRDKFKSNSDISKIFQALITNFLIKKKEITGERVHYMSMSDIVNKVGVIGENHNKYNRKREIEEFKNSEYDLEEVIYALTKWDEKHFKDYYNRHYTNGYSLYKRALDNLQDAGILQYYKGHRITYSVYEDNILKKEYMHEFAHKKIRDSVFNGQWQAWLYMKNRFNLRSNPSKNDFNANTKELFSHYNNNFNNLKQYYNNILSEINIDPNNKLYLYEKYIMDIFKSKSNDMSFYDLFKKYGCWFIARELEKHKYNGFTVEVDYYYNAYEIVTKDLAIEQYSKNVISELMDKYDAKVEQLRYMEKGFRNKEDFELLSELAYFMINDERPEDNI